ncbi:MAG: type II toxin-antitoxin system HicB family antitoxin [Cyanobacteria bacterium J06648_1]
MSYKLNIIIEEDEDGFYAYCPELKGCQSQGNTLEEVQNNIQEAIELYLGTLSASETEIALVI